MGINKSSFNCLSVFKLPFPFHLKRNALLSKKKKKVRTPHFTLCLLMPSSFWHPQQPLLVQVILCSLGSSSQTSSYDSDCPALS